MVQVFPLFEKPHDDRLKRVYTERFQKASTKRNVIVYLVSDGYLAIEYDTPDEVEIKEAQNLSLVSSKEKDTGALEFGPGDIMRINGSSGKKYTLFGERGFAIEDQNFTRLFRMPNSVDLTELNARGIVVEERDDFVRIVNLNATEDWIERVRKFSVRKTIYQESGALKCVFHTAFVNRDRIVPFEMKAKHERWPDEDFFPQILRDLAKYSVNAALEMIRTSARPVAKLEAKFVVDFPNKHVTLVTIEDDLGNKKAKHAISSLVFKDCASVVKLGNVELYETEDGTIVSTEEKVFQSPHLNVKDISE